MSNFNAVSSKNIEQAPKNIGPYSQTVAFSHYNNLSAQLPIDPKTGALVSGGILEQATQCFTNIQTVLSGIGKTMNDVVRISVYVTNIRDLDKVDIVYKSFFPTYVPTRTSAAVNALPLNALVQVEAIVSHGEGSIPNAPQSGDLVKLMNNTPNAPLSALSTQAVSFSHYSNISAQLPFDPATGLFVTGGVKEQAAQCLKNIKAITNSLDVPFDDIVKMNVYVVNPADVAAIKEVYTTFFPDSSIARTVNYFPALTIIPVKTLPNYALVQMEATLSYGDGTPPQIVEDRHGIVIYARNTKNAPACDISTQSVAFSHYNHVSGQNPKDPKTGALVAGGIKEQTAQCLKNLKAIIENTDHVLEDVVKVNVYMADLNDLALMDEVYSEFFPQGTPARKVVGVGALETAGALIKIDATVGNAEGTPPQAK